MIVSSFPFFFFFPFSNSSRHLFDNPHSYGKLPPLLAQEAWSVILSKPLVYSSFLVMSMGIRLKQKQYLTCCLEFERKGTFSLLEGIGLDNKEYTYNAGDLGSIPGSGRYPGEGNGNPFQYSCLEKSHGQWSLAGYSP